MASVKKQTPAPTTATASPPTTTASPADAGILGDAGNPLPTAGATSGALGDPGAIGVPKYQTIGGQYVYEGTNYQRVIQGADGKFYAVDAGGNVLVGPDGKPVADQPTVDRSNNPIKVQATYEAPPGTQVRSPADVTGRIEPGSPAAQSAMFGPARYQPGQEVSILAGLPAELRAQVQQQMVDRGLAPSGNAVGIGGYDSNWANSFKDVLSYANANNLTWDAALSAMPIADRTTTTQRNHYSISLTAPEDLAATFKSVAENMIGFGNVPQDTIDDFVRGYQQTQRDAAMKKISVQEAGAREPNQQVAVDDQGNVVTQRSYPTPSSPQDLAAASTDSSGGVNPLAPVTTDVTEAPTAQTAAESYLKQHFSGAYGATQLAGQVNNLISMMNNKLGAPSLTGSAGTGP